MPAPATSYRNSEHGVWERIRYLKQFNTEFFFVIADFGPDGQEDFAQQEVGGVIWRSFLPPPAEREAAQKLRGEANAKDGWVQRIVLKAGDLGSNAPAWEELP